MTGRNLALAALTGTLAAALTAPALAHPLMKRPDAELVLTERPLQLDFEATFGGLYAYDKLDPATYREVGDIRIGETIVEPVWAGPIDTVIPEPTWAMSLAHASKLMDLWGVAMSSNELLAFAVEESALGCDESIDSIDYQPEVARNGCFNIDADFDYAALQALFPGRFSYAHADVAGGAHFETAALSFAYIAAVHSAELSEMGYAIDTFYDGAADPDAVLKVTGLTHALGADNSHTERIFDTQRGFCMAEYSLSKSPVEESCITNVGTSNFVRSVADHADALGSPSAPIYNGMVGWQDVLNYMNAITPIYPEAANSTVRAQVRAAFDSQAHGQATVSFADSFGSVLDALILALPAPEDVRGAVAADWAQ